MKQASVDVWQSENYLEIGGKEKEGWGGVEGG